MDYPFSMRHPVFDGIDRIIRFMTQMYERVLPVRFDLHFPPGRDHDGSNSAIQYFARRMVQHYAFHAIRCLYVIVRVESDGTGPPCYLCLFLFDGTRCSSCQEIYHQADYLWRDTLGYEGSGLLRDGYPAALRGCICRRCR